MNRRSAFWLALVVALVVGGITAVRAIWVADGVLLCTEPGNQYGANQTTDGSGGAIVAWFDLRSPNPGIYAQRIGATGGLEWGAQGAPLYTYTSGGGPQAPDLSSDGSGGAIVVWNDYRPGATDIYGQRVDDSGTAQWAAAGLPICTATGYQFWPVPVSDGAGGAIIAWKDGRGADYDVYAQRVDASGAAQWTVNGVPICTATGNQESIQIVPDGAGGAIIVWADNRGADTDVYAQRINASGTTLWTANGRAICTLSGWQGGPQTARTGAGGAIIVWTDQRAGNNDIYAQRVNGSGSVLWTANGIPACADLAYQSTAAVTTDGANGAIIAWEDARTGAFTIFTQRISSSGAPMWIVNGIQATPGVGTGAQLLAQLVSDGTGGAIITWHLANYGGNVDAQRVNSSGALLWGSNGVKICAAPTGNQLVRIGTDGAGGAIITWQDDRLVDDDVRAQQVGPNGCVGDLPASIRTVADVPGDQGGLVRVTFSRSNGDRPDVSESAIASYTIWQRIDDAATSVAIAAEGSALEADVDKFSFGADAVSGERYRPPSDLPLVEWNGRVFHRSSAAWGPCGVFPPGTWEAVLSLGATRQESYVGRVTTVRDSSDTGIPYSVYVVTTHTHSAAWYLSLADSGYSVDNIPPGAPTGMTAAYNTGSGNQLDWDVSPANDFQYFRVYRGNDPSFVPGPATLVDVTISPSWTDPDYDGGTVSYKVTAVDQAGNEGPPGSPDTISAADDGLPARAALYANAPNPFNPNTVIAYDVPNGGADVTLRVYDVSGGVVRTLVTGVRTAGRHRARWEGRDDGGRSVASGVYFYRLEMEGFSATRKMLLLK